MIVNELKRYIEEHGTVSRSKLARHFALSEDGVDAMMEIWAKKGKVSRITSTGKQGEVLEVKYSIVDNQTIPTNSFL